MDYSAEDSEILRITQELKDMLDVKVFWPNEVVWTGTQTIASSFHEMPYDEPEPFDGGIMLAKTMKGKLSAEEWKPLIASSLLFHKKHAWERYKKELILFLPTIVVAFTVLFSIIYLVPYSIGQWVFPGFFLIAVGGMLYLILRVNLIERSFRARADREVASLLGKESILNTLRKIDAMHLRFTEAQKGNGWLNRHTPRPNIDDRISNLNNY